MSLNKVNAAFPESNLTWKILNDATQGGYAVGAFNCYNNDGVMAVIRAAEAKRSPALIEIFPWTMHFQGPHFVKYIVEAAHGASVPIGVHLDHCMDPSDVEQALTLPIDSIMVDASRLEPEENTQYCKRITELAKARGITVEAELGRINGGEDGIPDAGELEEILTDPQHAADFARQTGVHYIAPSFGNIHGPYPEGGSEKYWQLDRLKDIADALGPSVPLVIHGTHPVPDWLFREAIEAGARKVNINRNARDDYTKFVAENAGRLELTALKEQSVAIYQKSVEALMDVLGSSGQAP
ncbi:class II fructose-bisphosphate aldolase [Aspergillus fijiensis CBS 313.89]|uniref:Fructose-bisphosphate aldolase n=1 Tax=Aspergillus fijiensis CBS 313.89 TaxID=1448319 RepID=A0A8G1RZ12_9EURO|nr:fructose-bisphosphate aldolase [Aspergillus fijiensis CBS 313.89]RAK80231.1 fructose-bisphosphate aldolase [Aspergillus fijiensis CBS 313.89]